MAITVHTPSGESIDCAKLSLADTVIEAKGKLAQELGALPSQLVLMHGDSILQDALVLADACGEYPVHHKFTVVVTERILKLHDERLQMLMGGKKYCGQGELSRDILLTYLQTTGIVQVACGLVSVTVEGAIGTSLQVQMDLSDNRVSALKATIEDRVGIPKHKLELFLEQDRSSGNDTAQLKDEHEIVESCSVSLRVQPSAVAEVSGCGVAECNGTFKEEFKGLQGGKRTYRKVGGRQTISFNSSSGQWGFGTEYVGLCYTASSMFSPDRPAESGWMVNFGGKEPAPTLQWVDPHPYEPVEGTACEKPSAVQITGCGHAEFNGTYNEVSMKGGKPAYRKLEGNQTISHNIAAGRWCFGRDYVGAHYQVPAGGGDRPPERGWRVGNGGKAPEPTLRWVEAPLQ